jgi:hypothetical protein
MSIRHYQPGDESAKVAIYNEAASQLPFFVPAKLDDIRRRCLAKDFDKTTLLFAVDGAKAVGYASFSSQGRVSFPWCRPGHESHAEELFQHVLTAMKDRGHFSAFAAYRGDWPVQITFLESHGFKQVREMVNFVVDLAEMPTPARVPPSHCSPVRADDIPSILQMVPGMLRIQSAQALEQYLLSNRYFDEKDLFVLRDHTDGPPLAVGLLIDNSAYADPRSADASMPCFRAGAFGTEGLSVKRINGLFSMLMRPDSLATRLGLELLGQAAARLDQSDLATLAAQVPSDVPHLSRFYQQYFRRQGSFPVYEKNL